MCPSLSHGLNEENEEKSSSLALCPAHFFYIAAAPAWSDCNFLLLLLFILTLSSEMKLSCRQNANWAALAVAGTGLGLKKIHIVTTVLKSFQSIRKQANVEGCRNLKYKFPLATSFSRSAIWPQQTHYHSLWLTWRKAQEMKLARLERKGMEKKKIWADEKEKLLLQLLRLQFILRTSADSELCHVVMCKLEK